MIIERFREELKRQVENELVATPSLTRPEATSIAAIGALTSLSFSKLFDAEIIEEMTRRSNLIYKSPLRDGALVKIFKRK